MNEVKRVCRAGAKIVVGIIFSIGLIGFIKGLIIGYYVGLHKDKSIWQHKM